MSINSTLNSLSITSADDLTPLARTLLSRCAVLGVLDTEHLKDQALDRSQRDQALEILRTAGLFAPLPLKGHLRVGRTGRPPAAFMLTEEGTVIARQLGHRTAHAYAQTNPINQAHDVCTLDVRWMALADNLPVETEHNLISTPRLVRPDNVITLPDGRLVLFETEGYLAHADRARVVDKALGWDASASALQQGKADLNVRVLFNLKNDRALIDTQDVWAQGLADAQNALGRPLAIVFWGKPLNEFVAQPTWDSLDGFTRLDDPSRATSFGPVPAPTTSLVEGEFSAAQLLPPALRGHLSAQPSDILLLQAHARYFQRHLLAEIPHFSPVFFDLVNEIYAVAFAATGVDALSIPAVALFMLRTYIWHYPDLQRALTLAYKRYHSTSGVTMARQRALEFVHVFLNFHGLRHDRPDCKVSVAAPDLDPDGYSIFTTRVSLRLPSPDQDTRPESWETHETQSERSLAWVLQQLLDYPDVLGINGEETKHERQSKR